MCAAVAGPVRPLKVSVNLSLLPVRVPVKLPDAFVFLTTCFGISWAAVSFAPHIAGAIADEAPPKQSAATKATNGTTRILLIASPFLPESNVLVPGWHRRCGGVLGVDVASPFHR